MDGAVTVDAASEAIRLAQSDARRARRLATQALAQAALAGDAEGESMAERALGLAAVEQGRPQTAVAHLRRAVAAAERVGLTQRVGEARMSLSWALALRGATGAALEEAERAAAVLRGRDRARAQAQRALLLQEASDGSTRRWRPTVARTSACAATTTVSGKRGCCATAVCCRSTGAR